MAFVLDCITSDDDSDHAYEDVDLRTHQPADVCSPAVDVPNGEL